MSALLKRVIDFLDSETEGYRKITSDMFQKGRGECFLEPVCRSYQVILIFKHYVVFSKMKVTKLLQLNICHLLFYFTVMEYNHIYLMLNSDDIFHFKETSRLYEVPKLKSWNAAWLYTHFSC
jgi:hypothetical protein